MSDRNRRWLRGIHVGAVLLILLGCSTVAPPFSDTPSPRRATLTFVLEPNTDQTGAGIHGVGEPHQFPPRQVLYIEDGYRTVWYDCPEYVYAYAGPNISYHFQAGKSYQLACRGLAEGTISRNGSSEMPNPVVPFAVC